MYKNPRRGCRAAKKLIIFVIIFSVIAFFNSFIYLVPLQILPENKEEITSIYIFDGSTGRETTVSDPVVVERIAGEFKGKFFKCKGLSLGMGSSYHLTFNFESGRKTFTLQFVDEVRYGHFSLVPADGKYYSELYLYLDDLLDN